jgi:hypothetical protein
MCSAPVSVAAATGRSIQQDLLRRLYRQETEEPAPGEADAVQAGGLDDDRDLNRNRKRTAEGAKTV